MNEYNLDLHLHSPYAGGVSKFMSIPKLAEQAEIKGLHGMATGDIFQKDWLAHCKKNLVEQDNCFVYEKFQTKFILQTEVQASGRVHHLIYFKDFTMVQDVKEKIKKFSTDIDKFGGGRPRISLSGEKIAEHCLNAGALIGPSHAFTPYFGIYAHYNSIKECYQEFTEKIKFVELGLSADTDMADRISELRDLTFLSNSDSHSPWPIRIGREFNKVKMQKINFEELKLALERKKNRCFTLNAGLDPKEGIYHLSACRNCLEKYSLKQSIALKWKCVKCSGQVKKGVFDRALEVSDQEIKHPSHRPKYLHLIPFAEIIQLTLKVKNAQSVKVTELYNLFIFEFKNEINILLNEKIENLKKINQNVGEAIESFRQGFVYYIPGGGGAYGKPVICKTKKEFEDQKKELENKLNESQKSLVEFQANKALKNN